MTRTYLDDEHTVPTHAEAAAIRDYLDHGVGGRIVRVHRTGEVRYYGSTDPYNRDHDYWHCQGCAEEILQEIAEHKARLAILRDETAD